MSATDPHIPNRTPGMAYRRFGRSEHWLSVFTLGGMRFRDAGGQPREEPSTAMIDHCAEVTSAALEAGINHIETAWGYGKSEYCYGIALNNVLAVPRSRYHLMTKGHAMTGVEMREMVEAQLTGLKTDRIDLYGWHGINTPEILATACAPGGPVEELHKLREEGVIGSVGFSTHGPLEVIVDTLATGLFDFVNLHYYYFLQRNKGAVDYAGAKDIGVFIISPNDKGGRLFEPSPRLRELCTPLTPIQFNAKWCLKQPAITTLSFGLTEQAHIDEMLGALPARVPLTAEELAIECRMNAAILADPDAAYEGWEIAMDQAGGINVGEVLRQRRMATCYDHHAFGQYRYNMFSEKGHWFPGAFATPERVAAVDPGASPVDIDIKPLLNEAHKRFYRPKI